MRPFVKRALVGGGVAGLLGAAALWSGEGAKPARDPQPARTEAAPGVATPRPAAPVAIGAALQPLPSSLRGTTPDGALRVDADGHLVADVQVRWFFDYFLTASGEEALADIRARIAEAVRAHLSEPARSEALSLLDGYLAYREAGAREEQRLSATDLEGRLTLLKRLRREHLGAAADAFFGEEEVADAVALARHRLAEDGAASPAQLQALEQGLPPALREARAQTIEPLVLHQEEERLRAQGASAEELQAFRVRTAGPAAAQRLAALDQARAGFQSRLAEFRAARAAVSADSSLDAAAKTAAIEALAAQRFSPQERMRVNALDRLQTLR